MFPKIIMSGVFFLKIYKLLLDVHFSLPGKYKNLFKLHYPNAMH